MVSKPVTPTCPVCQNPASRCLGTHSTFDTKVWHCDKDNLSFCYPSPSASHLSNHYDSDYRLSKDFTDDYKLKHYRRAWSQYRYLRHHLPLKKIKRVLDIGCNFGALLDYISDSVPVVNGLELHTPAINTAPSHIKDNIRKALKPTDAYSQSEAFDLVTLSHVIEHYANPSVELVDIGKRIRPGGYLFIETPNVPADIVSLMASRNNLGDHLLWFTPQAIISAAASAGFQPISGTFYHYGRKSWTPGYKSSVFNTNTLLSIFSYISNIAACKLAPLFFIKPKLAAVLFPDHNRFRQIHNGYNMRVIFKKEEK
jgi:2-polyprenyl-3-methyl-5-hydroxy-6-metoxy-1,4-benzoquinol methylase